MKSELIVQILIGLITFAGVVITAWATIRKAGTEAQHNLDKAQAVTNTKIEELTREVRAHNDFAHRIPVLEEKIEQNSEEIKEIKNQINNSK